jgi:Growth-Arrest-Specific Protein 2 Domain
LHVANIFPITEAPTKRHEVVSVADMFDANSHGSIDWEEFLVALRPEWQQEPACEVDAIHDEVRRLVMLCTCRQKFRVFQVGEGKYRVSFVDK